MPTSAAGTGDFLDASRAVNTGELIMQTDGTVLIVPTAASNLKLDHVLIGWKDTRETRRAVSNALPLLKHATWVSVVEIAAQVDLPAAARHAQDVVAWLGRHAIQAEGSAQLSTGDDATAFYAIGQDKGADVVVAGAYGQSRLREWVLGGVTRDLLLSANRCSLVSNRPPRRLSRNLRDCAEQLANGRRDRHRQRSPERDAPRADRDARAAGPRRDGAEHCQEDDRGDRDPLDQPCA